MVSCFGEVEAQVFVNYHACIVLIMFCIILLTGVNVAGVGKERLTEHNLKQGRGI